MKLWDSTKVAAQRLLSSKTYHPAFDVCLAGVNNFCSARGNWTECLGQDQLEACMSLQHLTRIAGGEIAAAEIYAYSVAFGRKKV